jgi:hypothetical protein
MSSLQKGNLKKLSAIGWILLKWILEKYGGMARDHDNERSGSIRGWSTYLAE